MLLNCGVGEDSQESLDCKEIQPVHPKGNQSWVFIGRIDAEAETTILWPLGGKNWLIGKDPDAGKDWRQEEKGKTGWDGWMASLTQWTWVWVNSRSWWWTGRPGVLQSMGSQRVGHNWATELNWTNQNQKNKNWVTWFFKWAKDLNRHFFQRRTYKWPTGIWKDDQLVIREMHIKTTMRYHLTTI